MQICEKLQIEKKEEFYGRSLIIANREMVEQDSDVLLQDAYKTDIALLVVGDSLR